jgi:ABC-type polar amino acid transport system ATPase subunit
MKGECQMAINSITLTNFTVFENIECEFSSGINIFIGENGTGKTHLLKVLYAITKTDKYNKSFKGENTFEGKHVAISNNFDHVIFPLFNAPVEGLAVNLTRKKTDERESAKIEVNTDKGVVTSYVASFGFVTAVNPSDVEGKLFAQESFFIPAKDMLSHSGLENDYAKRLLPFDETQISPLNNLKVSRLREHTELSQALMKKLSEKIGGKVFYRDGGYFIEKGGDFVNIALEAEGYKKLAVIYRALDTGYLQPGSILFWDEPEANLNPKLIPVVVDILLELARQGVQVFLATHDYMFAKYFEVKREKADIVSFHTLYKTNDSIGHECNENFRDLKINPIIDAFDELMDDVLGKNLGD